MSEQKLTVGKPAPEFCLQNDKGGESSLQALRGKWVVVYFYPKDNTSGCTTEALEFTSLAASFEQNDAVVLGVSPDSIRSHCKFRDAHNLAVTLLSDPETKVIDAYGAWQKKSLYGREYMGVERSTALIAPDGTVAAHWSKVKAAGHAEQVLAKLLQVR